jgi:hypothetical protein
MAAIPLAVQPSAPGAADLDALPPGRTSPERGLVRLPGPRSAGTGPRSGPGPCCSWPHRPPPRSGPAGSGSPPGPASDWSRRCPASGPHCTSTPRSPCQSASRPTQRTHCVPGSPPPAPSARGHAVSPADPPSSPARSAAPGRSPTTCWNRRKSLRRRGRSPPSCPACRSWSSPWGPPWHTCCTPTRSPRDPDQAATGTSARTGPQAWSTRTRPRPLRAGRTAGPGPARRAGSGGGPLQMAAMPAGTGRMIPGPRRRAPTRTACSPRG